MLSGARSGGLSGDVILHKDYTTRGSLRLVSGGAGATMGMERCGRRDGRLQAQGRLSPPVGGRHRLFPRLWGLHSCSLPLGAARSGAMLGVKGPVNDHPGSDVSAASLPQAAGRGYSGPRFHPPTKAGCGLPEAGVAAAALWGSER